MDKTEGHLVFVYGTLRRGASNAYRLQGGTFVRTAVMRGKLYRVDWYPGLVRTEGLSWVVGEIWQVSAGLLRELDEFEGVPAGLLEGEEYRRVEAVAHADWSLEQLRNESEAGFPCWVWEWKGEADLSRWIWSGDWLDIEKPRSPAVLTGLGCFGLIGIPLGGGLIAEAFRRFAPWLWTSSRQEALEGLCLLITPLFCCVLFHLAAKRRESGDGPRRFGLGVAVIWAVLMAVAFMAMVWDGIFG